MKCNKVSAAIALVAAIAGPAQAGGDYGDSIATATPVAINTDLPGRIGVAGDVDYVKFTLTSAATVQIFTTGINDTVGYLMSASGQVIDANDDSAGTQNFRIFRSLSAGTYVIKTRLYSPQLTGLYHLQVVAAVGSGGADDHGNHSGSATPLPLSTRLSGVLTAGDADWFAVNVPQTGRLTIQSTGSTDTFAGLFASDGSRLLLTDDDSGDGSNFLITKPVTVGRYFVKLRHYYATGTGAYNIRADFEPTAQPPAQPPALIAPLNTTVNPDRGTTFSWSNTGAANYRLVVSQRPDFAGYSESTGACNATCLVVNTAQSSYTKNSFSLSGQRYHWRVKADNGAWSRTGELFVTSGSSTTPRAAVHPLPSGRMLSNCRVGTTCGGGTGIHRGTDLMAPTGSVVSSLCDGVVIRNLTSQAVRNSVLVVRSNCPGRQVYAFYGHIASGLAVGTAVVAGQPLGTVRDYPVNNSHLHLGVAASDHPSAWGYGSTVSDFFDFRDLLR